MALTFTNYKTLIDKTILKRGFSYFRGGHVIDVEESGDGHWSAQVEGNAVYTVAIKQDQMGILSCDCSCPYDHGPYCKHIAAVLFAIENGSTKHTKKNPANSSQKRKSREEKVRETLAGVTKDKLAALLEELADGDQQIATMILSRYGDIGDEKKAYTRMVRDALKMGKNKRGFIDYYGSGRAANGVRDILARADVYAEEGDYQKATPIYQAVIEVVVPAIAYADDSNGELGDCIHCGLVGLSEVFKKMPTDELQKAFDYCLKEGQKEKYAGWDWGWDLVQIAADMVTTDAQRHRLYEALDKMAGINNEDSDVSATTQMYRYELAESIKLSVIDRLDDEEEKQTFLIAHLELGQFREHLVRFHIERGNLEEARVLCDEWLNQTNQRYPGLRPVFLAFLLEIAQQEKQDDEVVRLAEALFIDTREFKYFDLIKAGARSAAWPGSRDKLIAKVSASTRSADLALDIFVREEMWHKLLDAIKGKHRITVDHYRKYLEPRFPDEVGAIYERIVRELMEEKVDRKGYQEACRYIRRMKKLKQGQRADALVNDLRIKYQRRPALLEELNKI